MDMTFFDWDSIKANLISDLIFLIITLITTPILTVYILRKRGRRILINTFSHILIEFCDFLAFTNYRDLELNGAHIEIFTKRAKIKEYRFVAISIVNVFNRGVFPKIEIVIHQVHDNVSIQKSYEIFKDELIRLKELRIETEKILAVHSLYIDEKLIGEISQFCLQIRKLELTEKNNENFEQLSKKLGSEITGVFGVQEVAKIYQNIFKLILEILNRKYFDYSIVKQTSTLS